MEIYFVCQLSVCLDMDKCLWMPKDSEDIQHPGARFLLVVSPNVGARK